MVADLSYKHVFDRRGSAYHRAMSEHIAARRREFATLFARSPVRNGERVLDIPAGGGYLASILPAGATLVSRELSDGFGGGIPVVAADGDWQAGQFDHVVCLAALHHIDDQAAFIRKLVDHAGPGGRVHIADVGQASPVARFLDQFVGRYNGTGHHGRYLPEGPDPVFCGGDPAYYAECPCPWTFCDEADLVSFCTGLFGLDHCPPEALLEALDRYVGLSRTADAVQLNWRLTYIDLDVAAVRPGAAEA